MQGGLKRLYLRLVVVSKYLLLRMEEYTDLKRLGGNLINSVRGWCTQMGGRMCC